MDLKYVYFLSIKNTRKMISDEALLTGYQREN